MKEKFPSFISEDVKFKITSVFGSPTKITSLILNLFSEYVSLPFELKLYNCLLYYKSLTCIFNSSFISI